MIRTFTIGQAIEVIKDQHFFDLHNEYVPRAIVLEAEGPCLKIVFEKVFGEQQGEMCALMFHEVDLLNFSGNFGRGCISGLVELGFKQIEDYDYQWLGTEIQSTVDDHLVLRFDGGGILRVHCATADFVRVKPLAHLELGKT